MTNKIHCDITLCGYLLYYIQDCLWDNYSHEICLVSRIVLSLKFEMPDFENFDYPSSTSIHVHARFGQNY